MDFFKKIAVSLTLLLGLGLAGCSAPLLSDREIIRAVFFEKTAAGTRAVLLLEQDAEQPAESSVCEGIGRTPLQALQQAERNLSGDVFYGLMDLAAFSSDFSGAEVRSAGKRLLDTVRPVPKIQVVLLAEQSLPQDWAQEGQALYEKICDGVQRYGLSSGLQQLYVQEKEYALPVWQGMEYGFLFWQQGRDPVFYQPGLTAQLAAVLHRNSNRLDCWIGKYALQLRAQATLQCEAQTGGKAILRICLRDISLASGAESDSPQQELSELVHQELQNSFATLLADIAADGFDPLRLQTWTFALDGSAPDTAQAQLQIIPEY